jgi:hypothetical protein
MLGRWGFKGGGYRRVGGDFAEGGGLTLRGPLGAPRRVAGASMVMAGGPEVAGSWAGAVWPVEFWYFLRGDAGLLMGWAGLA